mmetsp:Transcript_96582/g.268459  ORF Transcript_96582/g.268459 Transcript_96582/m.268459 type:complete len:226 (+) Transcript_96582:306-983(+)
MAPAATAMRRNQASHVDTVGGIAILLCCHNTTAPYVFKMSLNTMKSTTNAMPFACTMDLKESPRRLKKSMRLRNGVEASIASKIAAFKGSMQCPRIMRPAEMKATWWTRRSGVTRPWRPEMPTSARVKAVKASPAIATAWHTNSHSAASSLSDPTLQVARCPVAPNRISSGALESMKKAGTVRAEMNSACTMPITFRAHQYRVFSCSFELVGKPLIHKGAVALNA